MVDWREAGTSRGIMRLRKMMRAPGAAARATSVKRRAVSSSLMSSQMLDRAKQWMEPAGWAASHCWAGAVMLWMRLEAGFDEGEIFGEQVGGDGGEVEVVAAEEEGEEVVGGEGDLADGAAGAAEEAFGEGGGAVVEFEVVDGHALVEDALGDEDFEEEAPLRGVPLAVEVGLLLGEGAAGEEAVDALATLEEAHDAGEEGDEGFKPTGVDDAVRGWLSVG